MSAERMKLGDTVRYIYPGYWGGNVKIIQLDTHPLGDSFALVEFVESIALPVPQAWVNMKWLEPA